MTGYMKYTVCDICGGYRNMVLDRIEHIGLCPNDPANRDIFESVPIRNAPEEPSSQIVDLATHRFKTITDPARHPATAALDEAYKWINNKIAEGKNIDHVIVFIGRQDSDGTMTKYLQSGNYNWHAQMGLVTYGLRLLQDEV